MTEVAAETTIEEIEELIASREAWLVSVLEIQPSVREMMASLDKWILATLVAVNGGATVALVSAAGDLEIDPRPAAAAFVVGVLLAILGAMAERNSAGELLDALGALREEQRSWVQALRDKDLEQALAVANQAERPHEGNMLMSKFYSTVAKYLYRGSLVAFAVGSVISGWALG
jgi:hypothetical protein